MAILGRAESVGRLDEARDLTKQSASSSSSARGPRDQGDGKGDDADGDGDRAWMGSLAPR